MAITPHLGITYVEQAQAQKEVTVNEALARLDAILHQGILTHSQNTPPASPAQGDVHLVGAAPTGAWAGYAHHVAYFDQIWRFIAPRAGAAYWVQSEQTWFVYHGSVWQRATYGTLSTQSRELFIPAHQMHPASSNGCAPLASVALGTNKPELRTLDFDAASAEYAIALTQLPNEWAGGSLQCTILWSHAGSAGNDVVWSIEALTCKDNISFDATFSTAVTVTDTALSAQRLHSSALSASFTPSGSSTAGASHLMMRIGRDASNGADNFGSDARLHGVRITYSSIGL